MQLGNVPLSLGQKTQSPCRSSHSASITIQHPFHCASSWLRATLSSLASATAPSAFAELVILSTCNRTELYAVSSHLTFAELEIFFPRPAACQWTRSVRMCINTKASRPPVIFSMSRRYSTHSSSANRRFWDKSSAEIRSRVEKARQVQMERFLDSFAIACNTVRS
jgi:hypothetical protein